MKPILQIDVELTPEQVKQMEGANKVLARMAEKGKPGAFIAQIRYIENKFNAANRAMHFTPRMQCYVIPNYLFKRIIKTINRASNPGNKIPRRRYWEAASTGILKYIKKAKVERRPIPHINETNSTKPFGGRYENIDDLLDDDIPF